MKWIETTNKNDPLTRDGEYRYHVPWLHSSVGDKACFSVTKCRYSEMWTPRFWHGNQGCQIGPDTPDLKQAKTFCWEYMKKMYEEFKAIMDEEFATPPKEEE